MLVPQKALRWHSVHARCRTAVLAGIVGAVLFPVTAESVAAVPRGFVGVMADGPLFSASGPLPRGGLDRVRRVEAIRVSFFWSVPSRTRRAHRSRPGMSTSTECPRASPRSDRVMAEAARRDLDVLPVVLLAPPGPGSTGSTWSPPATAASPVRQLPRGARTPLQDGGNFLGAASRARAGPDSLVAGLERAERPALLDGPARAWTATPAPPGRHTAIKRADPAKRRGARRAHGAIVAGRSASCTGWGYGKCGRGGPQFVLRRGVRVVRIVRLAREVMGRTATPARRSS